MKDQKRMKDQKSKRDQLPPPKNIKSTHVEFVANATTPSS